LKLLDEKSRYGYEIIKELDERSKGFYVPSPGMVYPALTYLEELGHATVAADGARKLYSITEPGKEHLTKNLAAADALLAQFGRVGERMDRVRRALDAQDSGEEFESDHEPRGSRELHRARRELKLALLDKWHGSREEQQRVAAILSRAAAEIAGK
jgi:DNA-binding PadR family transcriptional regulator